MSRSLWSLGLSPEEIATLIAKKELTGQIFFATLKSGQFPPHGLNGGNSLAADMGGSSDASDEATTGPALTISRGVKLTSLMYAHCRWPIGDPQNPDFCYCGEQKSDKSRYCEEHHAIAYRPVEPIEWEE